MSYGFRCGRSVLVSMLVVFLILTGRGGTALAEAKSGNEKPLFDYRQIQLDNGLKVITLEDFSCPIVSVQLWYHVGSKDENPERQGFAHMFEHMMFRGTDKLGPTDHFGLIRRVGGECNGYTSFDRTVYLETLPASQLELALWLESERMAFLKIDQDAFDTERKVVEEERRVKLNNPYGTLVENLLPELFKVHPYRWAPIGKIPHLRAASVTELRDFWSKYYVPSNSTLVIVGAVKHDDAQRLVKKYFGWIPKYEVPARVAVREPLPTSKRTVTIKEASAPAPGVGMVWRTVPASHKDSVVLDLLGEILGGGNSSRLYRSIVAQKQLAVMAQAGSWSLEQDGIFGAGAVLPPMGGDPNQVLSLIEQQISRVRTERVSETLLSTAMNQMLRGVVTQCLEIESKANLLGTAAVDMGDVSEVNKALERVRNVTAGDILRVAKEYLVPDRVLEIKVERNLLATVMGVRDTEEKAVKVTPTVEKNPPPPGRPGCCRCKDLPKGAPLAKVTPEKLTPKFSRGTLSNGLKVMVVPNHEVPFVSVQLGLLAGAWTETKPGTASMAMQMLTKGTAKHTEAELAEELETYAISLGGAGEMDTSSVTMTCLTEQMPRAMKLLGEVVLSPTFPDVEFAKLRKQVLTSLAMESAKPEYQAEKEFRKRLYGTHPYSRTATGEVQDVQALTTRDLKEWWSTYLRPDLAVLIVAGDIDEKTAMKLAEESLGAWRAKGPKPQKELPPIAKPGKTHIYLVDQPGSTQSQIVVGQLGITRKNPEYYVSRIVSSYFGWGFDSRLNKSIRVKKGLTYGVWGSFIAQRFAGDFRVETFSKTETTGQAVQAVLDEIANLRKVGPSDEELECTRSYMLGSFVGARETPQQIANDLWLIESQGLSDDYLERLLAAVAKTTKNDCEKAVRNTLEPGNEIVVVVGQASQLKADLEKIAPVTVVTLAANKKT